MPHTLYTRSAAKTTTTPRPVVLPTVPVNVNELAIITTHFNPCGYNLPRRNYWHWRNHLGDLAKQLVTVEISFDGHFMVHDAIKITAGQENILWQKEAAINVGLRSLPAHVKYVAWLDADMLFEDPEWAVKAIHMLKSGYSAVQLFDTVQYLDINGDITERNNGAVWNMQENGSHTGSPGGAWMAHRDYLDQIGGLTPFMITGGGDVPAADGLADVPAVFYEKCVSQELKESEDAWKRKAKGCRPGVPGYLTGTIQHLFHGTRMNRRYEERSRVLRSYSPLKDVRLNKGGILEWTGNNSELERKVKQYFADRREDGDV